MRGKVLRWTSCVPYLGNHAAAAIGRTEETGGWLFNYPKYEDWSLSQSSVILWLHGIRKFALRSTLQMNAINGYISAGAGKTKLVSRVIDHLAKRPHDEALAYFYCSRSEEL